MHEQVENLWCHEVTCVVSCVLQAPPAPSHDDNTMAGRLESMCQQVIGSIQVASSSAAAAKPRSRPRIGSAVSSSLRLHLSRACSVSVGGSSIQPLLTTNRQRTTSLSGAGAEQTIIKAKAQTAVRPTLQAINMLSKQQQQNSMPGMSSADGRSGHGSMLHSQGKPGSAAKSNKTIDNDLARLVAGLSTINIHEGGDLTPLHSHGSQELSANSSMMDLDQHNQQSGAAAQARAGQTASPKTAVDSPMGWDCRQAAGRPSGMSHAGGSPAKRSLFGPGVHDVQIRMQARASLPGAYTDTLAHVAADAVRGQSWDDEGLALSGDALLQSLLSPEAYHAHKEAQAQARESRLQRYWSIVTEARQQLLAAAAIADHAGEGNKKQGINTSNSSGSKPTSAEHHEAGVQDDGDRLVVSHAEMSLLTADQLVAQLVRRDIQPEDTRYLARLARLAQQSSHRLYASLDYIHDCSPLYQHIKATQTVG